MTFTAPTPVPGTQTYTALACTNSAMNTGCVGPAAVVTGGQITSLAFTPGTVGTNYYVTITAVASTGYLASTSAYAGPQAEESQVGAPTGYSTASRADYDGWRHHGDVWRADRHGALVVHREGVHWFHDDRDVLHPDELHVGKVRSRGSPRERILRADNRGGADGLRVTGDGDFCGHAGNHPDQCGGHSHAGQRNEHDVRIAHRYLRRPDDEGQRPDVHGPRLHECGDEHGLRRISRPPLPPAHRSPGSRPVRV